MAKKIFSIYPRTKEAMTQGLQLDSGRVLDFRGKTILNTSNEKLAGEVQEKYGQRQGGQAMVVHDEQLSKAKDSGSWDIVKTKNGDAVKRLHNYTFSHIGMAKEPFKPSEDPDYERIGPGMWRRKKVKDG